MDSKRLAAACAVALCTATGGGTASPACEVLLNAATPAVLTYTLPPPEAIRPSAASGGLIRPPVRVRPTRITPSKPHAPAVDYRIYMHFLEQRIRQAWVRPASVKNFLPVVTSFRVMRNGDLWNIRIEKSSGNQDVDNAALAALSNANPVDTLPAGAPGYVNVRFVFENFYGSSCCCGGEGCTCASPGSCGGAQD